MRWFRSPARCARWWVPAPSSPTAPTGLNTARMWSTPAASEVRFPLDPLWASPDIDAVGIDYYAPLADWRDGASHLDRALTNSIYDRDYLAGNLKRGEDYDW